MSSIIGFNIPATTNTQPYIQKGKDKHSKKHTQFYLFN